MLDHVGSLFLVPSDLNIFEQLEVLGCSIPFCLDLPGSAWFQDALPRSDEEQLDAFDLLAHRSAAVQQMDEQRQQLVAKMQAKFLVPWCNVKHVATCDLNGGALVNLRIRILGVKMFQVHSSSTCFSVWILKNLLGSLM